MRSHVVNLCTNHSHTALYFWVCRSDASLPLLVASDAVEPLVRVAYEGKGNVSSKNAAIALARLSRRRELLERLKELHGIEIIYQ